jgi:hypothetical protein
MKLKIFLFFLLLASSAGSLIQAQETIVDALKTPFMNEGLVEIDVDPAITALFGKPGFNTKTDSANYDMIKVNGFRILAFMGNDQKKSRTEAFGRQSQIKAVFSDMETYISYDAPNWRVLIGDFVTREEATFFQETLQKEFPQFGKEMYIITDKVNVPIAKTN